MAATLLLVDDDETFLSLFEPLLRDAGYDVLTAATIKAAHTIITRGDADIMILDVELPDGYGPSYLERLKREYPSLPVIMVTGYGQIEMAVEAMKAGASDFIQKPIDTDRLRQAIERAAEMVALQRELNHLRNTRNALENWVLGDTPAMKKVADAMQKVAPWKGSILLTGESGTGKEVVARLLHNLSPRANKPWIPVNCANFGENLLESELFGYEAGSFTGASKKKDGLFVVADGGTLFLDEISTLKLDLQAKLLRVLEDQSIRRLGGTTETKVDVRIIVATNRSLPEMVKQGEFRDDLLHRLKVAEIKLPPLRERRDDIPALVGFFIQKYNREMGLNVQGVGNGVMDALKHYEWPGNIRQLRNAVEHAMMFTDGDTLGLGHFPEELEAVKEVA